MSITPPIAVPSKAKQAALEALNKPLSPFALLLALRVVDVLVVVATGALIYWLYVWNHQVPRNVLYLSVIPAVVLVVPLGLEWANVYERTRFLRRRLPARRILIGWCISAGLLLMIAFLLQVTYKFSRVWAVSWFLVTPIGLLLVHVGFNAVVRRLANAGRLANRTVILGAGPQGRRLAQHLSMRDDPQIRLLGFIDDRPERMPADASGLSFLGDTEHLLRLVRENQVDQVIVALPWYAEERVQALIRRISETPVPIRLAPDMIGYHLGGRPFSSIAGLPMLNVNDRPISGWSHLVKETEDRVLAGLAVIALAPLMGAIALAVKLTSPGPVLFRQPRYGFNNNLIEILKFRTMYTHLSDDGGARQATRGDPRVTPLGRFLRRTSLDELPQLINVLRGDMSLVGPRPHPLQTRAGGELFETVVDRYAARHRVKPGITGWAQVNGWRGETDTVEKIRKRVEFDLHYIDNWSVWLDLVILIRTVVLLLRDEQAY